MAALLQVKFVRICCFVVESFCYLHDYYICNNCIGPTDLFIIHLIII